MHRDDLTVENSAPGAREIDRRTIAKGVAWTVPVVIVATAAPAAAASYSDTLSATKSASTWTFTFQVVNRASKQVPVVISYIERTRAGSTATVTPMPMMSPASSDTIPAKSSRSFTFTREESGNPKPAQEGDVFIVHFQIDGVNDQKSSAPLPKK